MRTYKAFSYLLLSLFFTFAACNSGNHSKTNLDDEQFQQQKVKIIYRIPSPIEFFNLLKNAHLEFHDYVLNPMGNWENYNVLKSQSINLGIYSADLAYTAAYEQYQESLLYFDLIRKLGEKVGIATVFNEEVTGRIHNNISNSDSLSRISAAYYRGMIDYLAENEKTTELALIYTGGWIETLFIICNTVDTLKNKEMVIKELAEQKLVAENLKQLLEMDSTKEEVKSVLSEVNPIFELFEKLKIQSSDNMEVTTKGDEIIVTGGNTYAFDDKQCENLCLEINKLRSFWIEK